MLLNLYLQHRRLSFVNLVLSPLIFGQQSYYYKEYLLVFPQCCYCAPCSLHLQNQVSFVGCYLWYCIQLGYHCKKANMPPAITMVAPATRAFAMSPLCLTPPSAIIGIGPCGSSSQQPPCRLLQIHTTKHWHCKPVLYLVVQGEP